MRSVTYSTLYSTREVAVWLNSPSSWSVGLRSSTTDDRNDGPVAEVMLDDSRVDKWEVNQGVVRRTARNSWRTRDHKVLPQDLPERHERLGWMLTAGSGLRSTLSGCTTVGEPELVLHIVEAILERPSSHLDGCKLGFLLGLFVGLFSASLLFSGTWNSVSVEKLRCC